MSPRIVVLQHEPETGLGAFAAVLDQAHIDYEIVERLRGPLPDPGAFHGAIALGGSLGAYGATGSRRADVTPNVEPVRSPPSVRRRQCGDRFEIA